MLDKTSQQLLLAVALISINCEALYWAIISPIGKYINRLAELATQPS